MATEKEIIMPRKKGPLPPEYWKKQYELQKARGETKDQLERQKARRETQYKYVYDTI